MRRWLAEFAAWDDADAEDDGPDSLPLYPPDRSRASPPTKPGGIRAAARAAGMLGALALSGLDEVIDNLDEGMPVEYLAPRDRRALRDFLRALLPFLAGTPHHADLQSLLDQLA